MNQGTKRLILRWIHIVFAIPVLGYIYSPFELLPLYAPIVRYVALPVIVLSGFWMWIGSTAKKSVLVPAGVLLILLGITAVPLAQTAESIPPGAAHSVAVVVINLFRVGFFVGLVCAFIGVLRNRKLKRESSPSEI
jgi:hypothetical protein